MGGGRVGQLGGRNWAWDGDCGLGVMLAGGGGAGQGHIQASLPGLQLPGLQIREVHRGDLPMLQTYAG